MGRPKNADIEVGGGEDTQDVQESDLKFKPFRGKEKLPDFKVITKGNAERGTPDVVELAEPRYLVMMMRPNVFKVVMIQKHPRGITRKLWKVIKTVRTRPNDVRLYRQLKECGVPGAI